VIDFTFKLELTRTTENQPIHVQVIAKRRAIRVKTKYRTSWLNLLVRIQEVPNSVLCPETDILPEIFRGFSQSLRANSGIVP
jgi:hypothetical protein